MKFTSNWKLLQRNIIISIIILFVLHCIALHWFPDLDYENNPECKQNYTGNIKILFYKYGLSKSGNYYIFQYYFSLYTFINTLIIRIGLHQWPASEIMTKVSHCSVGDWQVNLQRMSAEVNFSIVFIKKKLCYCQMDLWILMKQNWFF